MNKFCLMFEGSSKKYSKISSALKHYFLTNLYYNCLDLKQAADRSRINYSTAKIVLRDLNDQEKKFIKRLIRQKEKDQKEGMNQLDTCSYYEIPQEVAKTDKNSGGYVQIISRVGHNFFSHEHFK